MTAIFHKIDLESSAHLFAGFYSLLLLYGFIAVACVVDFTVDRLTWPIESIMAKRGKNLEIWKVTLPVSLVIMAIIGLAIPIGSVALVIRFIAVSL